jgi:hypothetical protein
MMKSDRLLKTITKARKDLGHQLIRDGYPDIASAGRAMARIGYMLVVEADADLLDPSWSPGNPRERKLWDRYRQLALAVELGAQLTLAQHRAVKLVQEEVS